MSNIFQKIRNHKFTFGHIELMIVLLLAGASALWGLSGRLTEIQTTQTYTSNHLESLAVQQHKTNEKLHNLSVQTGIMILRIDQLENDLVNIKYKKKSPYLHIFLAQGQRLNSMFNAFRVLVIHSLFASGAHTTRSFRPFS